MLPARLPLFLPASVASAAEFFAGNEALTMDELYATLPISDAELFSGFNFNALLEVPLPPVKREVKHEQVRRAGCSDMCCCFPARRLPARAAARAARGSCGAACIAGARRAAAQHRRNAAACAHLLAASRL